MTTPRVKDNDRDALKTCPLCEGDARVNRKSGVTGRACRTGYYREYVECKKCGLRTKDGKRPGAAVERWNRRAALASE